MWTVNADNLLVSGDGALNFVVGTGSATVSVFAVNPVLNFLAALLPSTGRSGRASRAAFDTVPSSPIAQAWRNKLGAIDLTKIRDTPFSA